MPTSGGAVASSTAAGTELWRLLQEVLADLLDYQIERCFFQLSQRAGFSWLRETAELIVPSCVRALVVVRFCPVTVSACVGSVSLMLMFVWLQRRQTRPSCGSVCVGSVSAITVYRLCGFQRRRTRPAAAGSA